MAHPARDSIYEAISSIRLIDPHTHINPHAAASTTLADLLGYHYYTELAHSAGMPKSEIEEDGIAPRELVRRLVSNLRPIENTAQYRWLIEICRMFFGFDGDRIDESNWESLYDSAESQMRLADWPQMVLDQSNVESVFLTNDFDDELSGFDTDTYIPCLRTDDLVFHLAKSRTRQRLQACTGIELDGSLVSLRNSLKQRFEHFVSRGARACAISLPPSFQPIPVSDGRAANALDEILRKGALADDTHQVALSRRVFWTLAELCDEFGLPFDLMIGVNRGVYSGGVFQGQDLYDSRVSLIQYRELFNSFPGVKFPVSVLASVTNQELVSYAWIFPNVITNGHWWYSNTPSFIARDAAARLEAVPQTKQIAYYSDAYKLEFVWPKFDMYRQILSGILADHFVGGCGWSEERAIELGRRVLRDNVDEIFPRPSRPTSETNVDPQAETWSEESKDVPEDLNATWTDPAAAASSAALAAGAIGMIEIDNDSDSEDSDSEDSDDEDSDSENGDAEFGDVPEDFKPEPGGFSTIDIPTKSDQKSAAEETIDDIETVLEDQKAVARRGESDDVLAQLERFQDESDLPELPTVLELEDTVKIDRADFDRADFDSDDLDSDDLDDQSGSFDPSDINGEDDRITKRADLELDPLPTADEIQAVDIADVELGESRAAELESNTMDEEIDSQPLDVGDILGDESNDDDPQSSPQVRMLRGDTSFTLDEDSLQLQADPATGELTFPVASSDDVTIDLDVEPDDGSSDLELRMQAIPPTAESGPPMDDLFVLDETVDDVELIEPDESRDDTSGDTGEKTDQD